MKLLSSSGLSSALLYLFVIGCGPDHPSYCANGTCLCKDGHDCQMPCASPPCHAVCEDAGTTCEASCANGECTCVGGAVCHFSCDAPPCHVSCAQTPECTGVCANGDCNCAVGSACVFDCLAGPCHVNCAGSHDICNGVCANGSCNCGPSSTCVFSCLDGDCSATCAIGSSCTLHCPHGNAGGAGCRFTACVAGEPQVCPGGHVTTCNAPCPAEDTAD